MIKKRFKNYPIRYSQTLNTYVIATENGNEPYTVNDKVLRVLETTLSLWEYYQEPEAATIGKLDAKSLPFETLIALGIDVEEAMDKLLTARQKQMILDTYADKMLKKAVAKKYGLTYAKSRFGITSNLYRLARYLEEMKRWDTLGETS